MRGEEWEPGSGARTQLGPCGLLGSGSHELCRLVKSWPLQHDCRVDILPHAKAGEEWGYSSSWSLEDRGRRSPRREELTRLWGDRRDPLVLLEETVGVFRVGSAVEPAWGQPVFVRGCYPVSRVATARGPGSAARVAWHGTQSVHQHRRAPLRRPLPAPSWMLLNPFLPAVLPCLSVCHSAGGNVPYS